MGEKRIFVLYKIFESVFLDLEVVFGVIQFGVQILVLFSVIFWVLVRFLVLGILSLSYIFEVFSLGFWYMVNIQLTLVFIRIIKIVVLFVVLFNMLFC